MIKTYTTPTISICLPSKAELIAAANEIVVTVSDGIIDVDVTDINIDGDIIHASMTEAQTGSLSAGSWQVEVTLRFGTKILKTKTTKTMKLKATEAVRDSLLGGEA